VRRVHLVAFLALLPCIAPCTGSAQATRSGRQTSVPAASIADAPLTGNGTPGSHLACPTASGSVSGCLGASDWTTFNSKQAGPLTGDVTTSGAAATLAASGVSANTYGSASQHAVVTFDAKGRATIATNVNPSLPTSAITSGTFADSLLTSAYSGVGACGANTWASTLSRNAAPTCTQPAFSNISGTAATGQIPNLDTSKITTGTFTDAFLASAYSGVGACGANTWASTLSRNASPTCTQPAFSNISGTAATGQIPNLDTSKITTGTFTDAFLASAYSGVGTCTNQFVSVTSRNAAPTCTTSTLAGPQHANQGTTTTVLHGNGAGNPSWAAVSLTTDVSGTLPIGNGGTGATTTSQNFAFVGPTSGSGAPSFRALVAGDIPSLDAGKITTGTLPQTLGGTGSGTLTCGANQHLTSSGTTYSCTTDTGGTGGTVPSGGLQGQFLYRHPYTGTTTDWGLFSLERREGRAYAKLDGTTSFAIIGALSSPTTSGSSIGYQPPVGGGSRPMIIFNTAATTGSTAGLIRRLRGRALGCGKSEKCPCFPRGRPEVARGLKIPVSVVRFRPWAPFPLAACLTSLTGPLLFALVCPNCVQAHFGRRRAASSSGGSLA
jgi:hypothetical protein